MQCFTEDKHLAQVKMIGYDREDEELKKSDVILAHTKWVKYNGVYAKV